MPFLEHVPDAAERVPAQILCDLDACDGLG
jgi:hypothetical protein